MADLFSKSYDIVKQDHPDWIMDLRIDKAFRDEFTAASKEVNKTEEVTFSVATIAKFVTRPGQKFPVMSFFDLPEDGKRIEGSGDLQLSVSTSIMPTVTVASCRWFFEADE
jgi:hypothetical protein